MTNTQLLIPCVVVSIFLIVRAINLFFKKPSINAIEIQNKYRKKRGESNFTTEETKKFFVKQRILGIIIFFIVICYLIFCIKIVALT